MLPRLMRSIGYARTGIWHALLTQPNMWVHITIAVLVSLVAWWLEFARWEWAVLVLTISVVIILEMVNTVAEIVVDLASPDFSDLARTAKDVSAGAVLIGAMGAIIIGCLLFIPKLV